MNKSQLLLVTAILCFSVSSQALRGGLIANEPEWTATIGTPNCTGIVVTPEAVLTAAHCAHHLETKSHFSIYRRAESHTLYVDRVVIHPLFEKEFRLPKNNASAPEGDGPHPKPAETNEEKDERIARENHMLNMRLSYDVAIIKLAEPIKRKEILSAIPTLYLSSLHPDHQMMAVGMGVDRDRAVPWQTDPLENVRKRRLPVSYLRPAGMGIHIVTAERHSGICPGDSGGGLYVKEQGQWMLGGILVAISGYCGEKNQFYFSQPLEAVAEWLIENIGPELKVWRLPDQL